VNEAVSREELRRGPRTVVQLCEENRTLQAELGETADNLFAVSEELEAARAEAQVLRDELEHARDEAARLRDELWRATQPTPAGPPTILQDVNAALRRRLDQQREEHENELRLAVRLASQTLGDLAVAEGDLYRLQYRAETLRSTVEAADRLLGCEPGSLPWLLGVRQYRAARALCPDA
jgi:chromosome segregation ATPase